MFFFKVFSYIKNSVFMTYQNVPDAPVFTRQPNWYKPLFYAKIKEIYRLIQKQFNKIENEKINKFSIPPPPPLPPLVLSPPYPLRSSIRWLSVKISQPKIGYNIQDDTYLKKYFF
ncbi:hypothetical protein J2W48_002866 [Flavobacterium piscis]|uniref:Uncharacterized protein n=1 Tax=Flavobacterium piscis TaxID=1114874 RepID=A0ABU1Y9M1_9FLAO|nr:hypothetical protein [Flavobacterium piscis]